MAGKPKKQTKTRTNGTPGKLGNVTDYRHGEATRTNNPPAKIAAEGTVPLMPKIRYEYSPRLAPVLRFDPTGQADSLPELLQKAQRQPLTADETRLLADALRNQEPWLEWANKREKRWFDVDPVALHIHERVSAQAILRVAARQDIEPSLFADPQQQYHEAVQFYRHPIPWTNRLILGDSLQVMTSLSRREDLAGKVQMIYMDPPYGIKFGSNFQPEVARRDVKDKDEDLTREPEMVKAYRDTWHLGIHSYLSYLRDRLVVARELLSDSGSLFLQIGDENLHRVRIILDEVFGQDSFVANITFRTTSNQSSGSLGINSDHLLWYARDAEKLKYHQVYVPYTLEDDIGERYTRVELTEGTRRFMNSPEREDPSRISPDSRVYRHGSLVSAGSTSTTTTSFEFEGVKFHPGQTRHWKTTLTGMKRLDAAGRLAAPSPNSLAYVRFLGDFAARELTNVWTDTQTGAFTDPKVYVVQTNTKVITRCVLMATDPGDLVLDPTCGSGTTAFVAEQWGRRWITVDTSRVSIAIARQRLMTAKYDFYCLKDEAGGIANNFVYKTVPHITLKSIAQNQNLDPIFAKYQPPLDEALRQCNAALKQVDNATREGLRAKLLRKQKEEGRRAISEADRRRWMLPEKGTPWEYWQVPFDTDPDWPQKLKDAVSVYRTTWRAKMDDVNACIAANAEQEELVDRPEAVKGIVRVSGPFTVEAVQPPEMSLGEAKVIDVEGFGGAPDEMETFELRMVETRADQEAQNIDAYLDQMIRYLKMDGVLFPNNKTMKFHRLEPVMDGSVIHAEGRWANGDADHDPDGKANVGVVFGPQYGPVTAMQVEESVRQANRRGYDHLVIAGFSFDGPAQAVIAESSHPKLKVHAAHIRPDVNPGMAGLLKEQPGSQLFSVFGQPRTVISGPNADGEYRIAMEGVDIYNPVDNTVTPTNADKVAAWFIDSDYDGRTFCITQAFFPDKSAWEKLSKALDGIVDAERFEALNGTKSLPFPLGKHRCVAVKVIDPRGNEVMRIHPLRDRRGR
ncbi:MAG: site-specific DNA-methyltransferase [Acidobacteriaceae bacterium]